MSGLNNTSANGRKPPSTATSRIIERMVELDASPDQISATVADLRALKIEAERISRKRVAAALRSRRYRARQRDGSVTQSVTQAAEAPSRLHHAEPPDRHASSVTLAEAPVTIRAGAQSEDLFSSSSDSVLKNKTESRSIGDDERDDESPAAMFEDLWELWPKREGRNPKKPARLKFIALLKKGASWQDITDGLIRFKATLVRNGTEPRFVPQMITWLNQEGWNDVESEIPRAQLNGTVVGKAWANGRNHG